MRILLISDKFVPERGGSQIIFGATYSHVPEHEVTVITREWPGDRECDRDYPHRVVRVPYSRVPKLRSPVLWSRLAATALRLTRQERFDQIHCGQTVETAPLGTLLARRLRVPCVVHTFAEDVTTYLKQAAYGSMMRGALARASVVTSISQFTVDHLRQLGVPEERLTLLYPGVTLGDWTPTGREQQLRQELDLEGRRVLLSVSRLIPRKGQDVTIRALPAVVARHPNVAYVVVGDGPEMERLRALAQSTGMAPYIRFVGSKPNRVTVDYHHLSDIFVMPNREMPNGDIEGFGLVFLEANACRKPVIGGRSGGAIDAIEHERTGLLVNPTSSSEVAGAINLLLDRPELAAEYGRAGRERVEQRFTWEQSGKSLHRVISLASSLS